jgi:hypothetical protein
MLQILGILLLANLEILLSYLLATSKKAKISTHVSLSAECFFNYMFYILTFKERMPGLRERIAITGVFRAFHFSLPFIEIVFMSSSVVIVYIYMRLFLQGLYCLVLHISSSTIRVASPWRITGLLRSTSKR